VPWAQYALTHLKPGGLAVLAMSPSAAAAPSGRQARAQMLRQGVLRAVIALPVAAAPPYVPLHLWILERPDREAEPDLTALFVEATPESRTGVDYAASAAAGTMPTASWFSLSLSSARADCRRCSHLAKTFVSNPMGMIANCPSRTTANCPLRPTPYSS